MAETYEYLTDDGPTPLDGGEASHYLVARLGRNGDVYVGTRATNERTARTVRFRFSNGGASDHPRLRAAVSELASAMKELHNDPGKQPAATNATRDENDG